MESSFPDEVPQDLVGLVMLDTWGINTGRDLNHTTPVYSYGRGPRVFGLIQMTALV